MARGIPVEDGRRSMFCFHCRLLDTDRTQVREDLSNVKGELRRHRQSAVLLPKGTLHCIVNATPLFQTLGGHESMWGRMTSVGFAGYSLRHDIQVRAYVSKPLRPLILTRKGSTRKLRSALESKPGTGYTVLTSVERCSTNFHPDCRR